MKVNKSSWHYRLMNYFNFDIISDLRYGGKVTLCKYFWNVIGSIITLLGAILLSIAGIFVASILLLSVVIAPISYLTQAYFGFGWDFASELGVGLIWILWVVIPLGIGVQSVAQKQMKVFPAWMKISLPETVPNTKPNILVEYVKAKKNKFCPIIEVSDD